MNKYIARFLIIVLMTLSLVTGGVVSGAVVYAASGDAAIKETRPMTDAVFKYLDEIYIQRFPEMGLEPQYGSYKDIAELQDAAEEITKNCMSDKEKTEAIVNWTVEHINYDKSYLFCCYPIDVYHHRVAVCYGYAYLMQQFLRLEDIPAVVCNGYRGNMTKLTFKEMYDDMDGHSWVFAHYDGAWHLYDPISGEFNTTDHDYIASKYAVKNVEGILPYYEGMDINTVTCGFPSIIYRDGKFWGYTDGELANGNMGTLYNSSNNMIYYRSDIKDFYNISDRLLDDPDGFDKMQIGECFSGGWTSVDGVNIWRCYMNNAVCKAAKIVEYKGNPYVLGIDGGPVRTSREFADSCTFELGVPAFEVGETFSFIPDWYEQAVDSDRVVVYEDSSDPEFGYDGKVKVDQNGIITMLSPGYASVNVLSKDDFDDPGCYDNSTFNFYIKKDFAQCKIRIDAVPAQKYTGKQIRPQISIYDDKKTLVEYVDYVTDYSNNIQEGTATVSITGVGNYKGKYETSFKIEANSSDHIGGKTLSAVSLTKVIKGKKSATIKWKKVSAKNRKKISKIQIQYSTDKNFKTGVLTVYAKKTDASKKIKKLKSKKRYYFRIRAYKKIKGVEYVSKWSIVKSVKIR